MRSLRDLQTFIDVAKQGSISAVARQNQQTPAAISSAIKRLEQELNAVLFIRSTRSIRLTVEGEHFFKFAQDGLHSLKAGVNSLNQDKNKVSGTLQISMPSDLGRNALIGWLDEFIQQYPEVKLKLHLTDETSDLYAESIDFVLRYGIPPDSQLIASQIAPTNRRILVASPQYLEKHGMPQNPRELLEHRCITFMLSGRIFNHWLFYKNDEQIKLKVDCYRIANDGEAVRKWAVEGFGIAYKSKLDVIGDLAAGRLIEICPTWQSDPLPLYLLYADKRQMTPLIESFREFLRQKINQIT